jgi:hypothetical protein
MPDINDSSPNRQGATQPAAPAALEQFCHKLIKLEPDEQLQQIRELSPDDVYWVLRVWAGLPKRLRLPDAERDRLDAQWKAIFADRACMAKYLVGSFRQNVREGTTAWRLKSGLLSEDDATEQAVKAGLTLDVVRSPTAARAIPFETRFPRQAPEPAPNAGWLATRYPMVGTASRNSTYFRCRVLEGVCIPRYPELHQRLKRTRGGIGYTDEHAALTASGWDDDSEPTPAQLEVYLAHLERVAEIHLAWHLEHKRPWPEMYNQPAAKPATKQAPTPPPPASEPGPTTAEPAPDTFVANLNAPRNPVAPAMRAATAPEPEPTADRECQWCWLPIEPDDAVAQGCHAACLRAAEADRAKELAAAPEPADPVTLDHGPTGPALAAAALEHNWYVAQIQREPGKTKLKKVPLDAAGRWTDVQLAATRTLVEALHQRDLLATTGIRVALGYLPRPGSILVGGDLDDCLPPSWKDDQEPTTAIAKRVLAESATYAERSIGGLGIRLLMKRDPRTPLVTAERDGAGLYADGRRGIVLTFDPLPGRGREIINDGRVEYLITEHIRQARYAAAQAFRDHDQPRPSGYPWFDHLDPDQQLEELPKLLAALPEGAFAERGDGSEPDHWISILMAVKHHFDEDGYEHFDDWSENRAGGNYDPEENRETWDAITDCNSEGRARTIGTLIWLARQHGYEPPPGATRPPPPSLAQHEVDQISAAIRRHYGLQGNG